MKTLAEVNFDELSRGHGIPETERPMGVLTINQNIVGVIIAAGMEPKYFGDNRGYIHVRVTEENYIKLFFTPFGFFAGPGQEFKGEITWTNFLMNGEIEHHEQVCSMVITQINISPGIEKGITITCQILDKPNDKPNVEAAVEPDCLCPAIFKSELCGYKGSETECNKTFGQCKELKNEHRFQGWPGVYVPKGT